MGVGCPCPPVRNNSDPFVSNYINRMQHFTRYSPTTNEWSLVHPMNQKRSSAGGASLNDRVYVVGGFNGKACLNSAEVYDPQDDQSVNHFLLNLVSLGRTNDGLQKHNRKMHDQQICFYQITINNSNSNNSIKTINNDSRNNNNETTIVKAKQQPQKQQQKQQ